MEMLFKAQEGQLRSVSREFVRFLYKEIDWTQRLIGVKGPRGAGKTTLLLQYLKYDLKDKNALYVSADHPYFYQKNLYELAEEFSVSGGQHLLIDEVHKAPNWSREIKSIYDSFPDLQLIFTSSSALDVYKGEADLSRRLELYVLPGLSFREYVNWTQKLSIPSMTLEELLGGHQDMSKKLLDQFKPIPIFKEFLRKGYLPFSIHLNEPSYQKRLIAIINTVLETDLLFIKQYSVANSIKMKRLLGVLAELVPYEPNVSELAKKLTLGRDTVSEYLANLENAGILNFLLSSKEGLVNLRKPRKIYLENTNFSYALKQIPDVGNLRETFALNQLLNSKNQVRSSSFGDFLVNDKWTLEVGGKNKSFKQIKGVSESYLAIDDIEIGVGTKVPLFLFGFLY